MSGSDDDSMEDPGEVNGHDLMEKDKTEIQLEKLVFGDTAGFHESLKSHDLGVTSTSLSGGKGGQLDAHDEQVERVLEDIDDADVCTLHRALGLRCMGLTYSPALLR